MKSLNKLSKELETLENDFATNLIELNDMSKEMTNFSERIDNLESKIISLEKEIINGENSEIYQDFSPEKHLKELKENESNSNQRI